MSGDMYHFAGLSGLTAISLHSVDQPIFLAGQAAMR
jgi:hypothetical protein